MADLSRRPSNTPPGLSRSRGRHPHSPPPSPPPPDEIRPTPTELQTFVTANLVFRDEFDGSSLDLDLWTPNWLGTDTQITVPVSTAEDAAYDPAQVTVTGGNCVLTPIQSPILRGGKTYPNRSGMIQTDGKFNFEVSTVFEARIFLPSASATEIANFPAFWTDGQPPWPTNGEIDIVEGLGPAPTGDPIGHYHWGVEEDHDLANHRVVLSASGIGWHIYTMYWEFGSRIRWWMDGALKDTYTTNITSSPQFLIINNAQREAVGGTNVYGASGAVLIDYVRCWQALAP